MKRLTILLDQLCGLCPFSKKVLKIGFWCFAGCILLSLWAGLTAQGACYLDRITLHRAALESGFTTLTTAVLAALLCDLIYQKSL
jgi:hypothetical protein